jgi:hypothetical protein
MDPFMRTSNDWFLGRMARAAEGEGGAGGEGAGAAAAAAGGAAAGAAAGGAAGAAGEGAAAGAAGGAAGEGAGGKDGAAAAAGAGDGKAGEGAGANEKPWYENRAWSDPALREQLIKSGYHKGTADEALERALKGEAAASKKLGKSPESLLDAPAEGQAFTDWLKANGKTFKAPESADGYKIELPEMPKGMEIDQDMLKGYRDFALEKGLPPELVQANATFFAEFQAAAFTKLAGKAVEADTAVTTALKEEWGANWKQNEQLAVRTFQALAAKSGMKPESAQLVAQVMNKTLAEAEGEVLGGTSLLKFMHSLSSLVGEDVIVPPGGANRPALALADAQQRKLKIMERHTGDLAQAESANDRNRVKALKEELQTLNKVIVSHGGEG